MAVLEATFAIGAIVLGVVLARRRPDTAKRWYGRIKMGRRVVFGAVSLLFAIIFVASGVVALMLIGAFILAYGTLLVIYEKPHEEVKAWVQ